MKNRIFPRHVRYYHVKKIIFSTLLIFYFISPENVFSQTWEQVENFPGTPRDDGSTFTIGSKYYCGLGMDAGFACTRDFFIFDGASSTWSTGVSLPIGQERQYATACSWENKGFVFGGAKCDGTFLNDLWSFDPITSIWAEITALPGTGRGGSVHFIIEDTLYIVGGRNNTGILSEVWGYDFTTGNWDQKTNYPNAGIWRGAAFSWQNTGYAGMGKNDLNGQSEFNTSIYSFDPLVQNWTLVPDFGLTPRFYIGSTQKDNLVFFFGGVDPGDLYLNSLERLDVSDLSLFSLPNFNPDPRKGSMCFIHNDYFYTTTGVSETQRLNETWRIGGILSLDQTLLTNLLIYPNPASNKITIDFGQILSTELTIYSLDGRFTRQYSIANSSALELNIRDLEEGVYIIQSGSLRNLFQIIR